MAAGTWASGGGGVEEARPVPAVRGDNEERALQPLPLSLVKRCTNACAKPMASNWSGLHLGDIVSCKNWSSTKPV